MGCNPSCALKKLAWLEEAGGLGGAQLPPFANTMLASWVRSFIRSEKSGMMGCNPSCALKKLARLQEAGGVGGGAAPPFANTMLA